MPARTKKADEVFVANTSGAIDVDGESMTFTKGVTRVANAGVGAKILKAVPDYFDAVDDRVHYGGGVEQATAAPGEKRGEE
jgi:hypothetical protein